MGRIARIRPSAPPRTIAARRWTAHRALGAARGADDIAVMERVGRLAAARGAMTRARREKRTQKAGRCRDAERISAPRSTRENYFLTTKRIRRTSGGNEEMNPADGFAQGAGESRSIFFFFYKSSRRRGSSSRVHPYLHVAPNSRAATPRRAVQSRSRRRSLPLERPRRGRGRRARLPRTRLSRRRLSRRR
jgi:hypothetical protein